MRAQYAGYARLRVWGLAYGSSAPKPLTSETVFDLHPQAYNYKPQVAIAKTHGLASPKRKSPILNHRAHADPRRLKVIPHRYTLREVRVEAGWKMFRPNKLCCRTAAVAECPDTPRSANIRFNSPGYVGIHHSEGIAIARETKCFHCAICPLSPDCPGDWH